MANLRENAAWESGIYQLETTDPVVGGVDGISNKQAIQLANRTSYLKEQIESNKSSIDTALAKKRNVSDSYSKTQTDEKFLKIGDYGLGGLEDMPFLQNIDDMTTHTGFYRAVENQTTGTFPQPYGGSKHAHVLVERVDVNWIKQTIVQISQDGTKPIFYRTNNLNRGWHPWKEVVAADVNGDFEGRWIKAAHFLMKTNAQDNIFDANSEICFRKAQASGDSPTHMRFATLAKFKETLGLSRGSVGVSGWVGLPMGLILQWGQVQNLGIGEGREIMFPIVFPNWTLSVVATPGLPSPNNAISSLHVNGFFKEKFIIQNTDKDSVYPAYWIAIGY